VRRELGRKAEVVAVVREALGDIRRAALAAARAPPQHRVPAAAVERTELPDDLDRQPNTVSTLSRRGGPPAIALP
jgi:hypothetical protein